MRKSTRIVFVLISLFIFHFQTAIAEEPIDAIKANVKKIVEAQKAAAPSITVADFKALMEKDEFYFEILDIRTADEYTAGHIAGAVHADRNKLEWVTPKKIKDPEVPIYVYCKAGSRGAISTLRLLEMGYTNVTNITGGMKAWAKAGYSLYNDMGEFTFTENGFGKKPE
ncbi:MAG: rhodanese-like domain-containing protein [Desulfobacterales bacterium]|nr:rhodanese-like domain-containing protein [Desulfobacterales bacterium]